MQQYDYSNIIGRAEKDFAPAASKGNSKMGKEEFLTLLVEQLKHQDPLNPMDDKEFTSQLAEFSSLEQLTSINDGIAALANRTVQEEMVDASSFIGKEVRAVGDNLSIRPDGSVSGMFYNLKNDAEHVYLNIFDENNNLLRTVQMGAQAAGEHKFEWDGKDWKGNTLPEGQYHVALAAEDKDGQPIMTMAEVTGVVEGVQYSNGQNCLRLSDGRVIQYNMVKEVVGTSTAANEEPEEDPIGSGGNDEENPASDA